MGMHSYKNIILKFLIGCIPISVVFSAFLKDVPVNLKQPDGTIIQCFITGDEFYGRIHDSDNYTIIQHSIDGYYYYAERNGEKVVPTIYRVDQQILKEELLIPDVRISKEEYRFRRNKYFEGTSQRDAPSSGTVNNINIFIRFADEDEFIFPRSTYDGPFNNLDGPSLNHYFLEVSNNILEVNTTHYPVCDIDTNLSYQDQYPRSYYQLYNAQTNPEGYFECPSWGGDSEINCDEIDTSQWGSYREHALLKNAVDFIEAEVPEDIDIDANDDGYVDNVTFLINGSPDGWAELLWPHRWSLYLYDAYINGALVDGYNVNLSSGGYFTVGVLCHEFGHSLGAPDYYRYYDESITPLGEWDLMAWNTNPPQYPSAWIQYRYFNWIDCPILEHSGSYELNALTDHINHCYLIESPSSDSEHFILEYRKNTGIYDVNLPGSSNGMLIYRINLDINRNNIIDTLENQGGWAVGGNGGGPPDEIYVYRPAGTLETNGNISMAIFSYPTGRTEINDTTSPSSFLSDGMPGGLDITDIGYPLETIQFTYHKKDHLDVGCFTLISGDVNLDSIVDILDIILMINHIMEFNYELCSDINEDEALNILDIILIINIIIGE